MAIVSSILCLFEDLDWIASRNMCSQDSQPLDPHLAVKQVRGVCVCVRVCACMCVHAWVCMCVYTCNSAVCAVKDGRTTLVQGNYLYYHYMQQNFNDNVTCACGQTSQHD